MYANRRYNVGDRVMFLAKGSTDQRGSIRSPSGLSSDHWRGNRLRDEPLILIEGVVQNIANNADRGGRNSLDVAFTMSTVPEELGDYWSSTQFRFDGDAYQSALHTVFQRVIPSRRDAGFGVDEESYNFIRDLMYPVVVVDAPYHALLEDIRAAAGNAAPSAIRSREAVIEKARSFGIPVRDTLIPKMYQSIAPSREALERATARWEEYSFARVQNMLGVPRVPEVRIAAEPNF